jgi:ribosomal protein S18 acetylase RimI-like enzyme
MNLPLPRTALDIAVVETRTRVQDGVLLSSETKELFLEAVIQDFQLQLGQTSAHVLGIVIQLLTRGKVRVDFRDYAVRFELGEGQPVMERTQAVSVFDGYVKRQKSDGMASSDVTQKIMVQAPRVLLPRVGR